MMYVVAAVLLRRDGTSEAATSDLVVLFSTIPQTFSSLVAARSGTSHLLLNSRDDSWLSYWATFLLAG